MMMGQGAPGRLSTGSISKILFGRLTVCRANIGWSQIAREKKLILNDKCTRILASRISATGVVSPRRDIQTLLLAFSQVSSSSWLGLSLRLP